MASKPIALPADLRQRGITPAAWKPLDNTQRREVIKQSRAITREATGKGAPEGTPAAKKRSARIASRATRFARVPPPERRDYWHKYDKGSEGTEFWALYTAIR